MDYENAELCYRKAIEIDDKKAEPYLKIADTSVRQGDNDKAREILEQARDTIPESSEAKQNLLTQQEEKINTVSPEGVNEDASDSQEDDKYRDEKNDAEELDIHKIAEEVTGYTYIGGKGYDLSYIRNSKNPNMGIGVPQTEPIEERGFFSAQKYDFDKDGQDEILVVVLECNEATQTQPFVLHMLEERSEDVWEDAAVMEVSGTTEQINMTTITDVSANERIDFFVKEGEGQIPYICIESYSCAVYFANGESWILAQIQYQQETFSVGSKTLRVAGSDIPAEITLDAGKGFTIDEVEYAQQFLDDFRALGVQAPSYLGLFTPLVYENEELIYIAECRKNDTASSEEAIAWQGGDAEKFPVIKVTLRDYTGKDREAAGRAGAAFTMYIRKNNPDAWYVIADMDNTPVLLVAQSTDCEEKSWLEWVAFADSAEVFIFDNDKVESVGSIAGEKGKQLYYAAQKITATTDTGAKNYKLSEKKLVQEDSAYSYNYSSRLEFHKCRQ